jgi:hypothetical protein
VGYAAEDVVVLVVLSWLLTAMIDSTTAATAIAADTPATILPVEEDLFGAGAHPLFDGPEYPAGCSGGGALGGWE